MIDEIKAPNVICKYWPVEATEIIGNYDPNNPNNIKYYGNIQEEYYGHFNIEDKKNQKKS